MTQNPPDQPGGQPGSYGSPEQYGAGDSYGSPEQQPQPGQYPYGAGQQQSYGAAPAGQPGGALGHQPYAAAGPEPPTSGGPGAPAGGQAGGPSGPPPGRRRSNAPVIAGIVIGGLVVLALLIWGAITLIDGRDDSIPTPTATEDASEDGTAEGEPSDDAADQPSDDAADPPAGAGELYDLLSTEAAEVSDGSTTWTVQGNWADASDLSPEAMEAYTATYASDAGEITMTAISFPGPGAADTYVAGVQDERGDPDYSGDVWQSDQGSGLGTRLDYDGDVHSIYWYDDTAVVYQVDAPDADAAQAFYGSLPF